MKSQDRENNIKSIIGLISEAGLLKRTLRTGWSVLGIEKAESVADHSFRTAVIGLLLAEIEGASTEKVLLMTLLNDLHEARLTDLHKMAQRYIDAEKAENNAFREQISELPKKIRSKLSGIRDEYIKQKTKESIIARDADILECLIQAKEYHLYGYSQASKFMQKAPGHLKTKSARKIWNSAKNSDFNNWWIKLSEFKR